MKCKRCKNKVRLTKHKFCSKECYWESLKGIRGENAPNYKKVVGKSQVHKWLEVHYGKPRECEMGNCKGKSVYFDWALKKGKSYERDRSNFFRLCRSCHLSYDFDDKRKALAIKNLWWKKGTKNPAEPFLIKRGQRVSKKTRLKMSIAKTLWHKQKRFANNLSTLSQEEDNRKE